MISDREILRIWTPDGPAVRRVNDLAKITKIDEALLNLRLERMHEDGLLCYCSALDFRGYMPTLRGQAIADASDEAA